MAQIAECPPCGADSLLCCRAIVLDSFEQAFAAPTYRRAAWPDDAASQIFSTRPPRDAIAGTASGLKTFGRSLLSGTAALICGPIEAARSENGLTLRGLCEGAAAAALLPCAGAAVGAAQCARGIAVTPIALLEAMRGKEWNSEERSWQTRAYSLPEEADQLEERRRSSGDDAQQRNGNHAQQQSSSSHATKKEKSIDTVVRCSSREYYCLLNVLPTASDAEIRRAYYRESRLYHPDKAGTDPRMIERFHQLSQAYQVLRCSDLRRAYDDGGAQAVARKNATVDLGSLYAAVLNGRQWEPFIGRLALSRILSSQRDDSTDPNIVDALAALWYAGDRAPDGWQAGREVRLAVALVERLQTAVAGDEEAFASSISEEALRLSRAQFAPVFLHTIAAVYASEASRFLGALRAMGLPSELAQARSRGRLMAQQARAAAAGTRAVLALRRLIADEERSNPTSSEEAESQATTLCLERPAVREQLPLLAHALWHFTVLDIEGTLRRVCRRVLRDSSVSVTARVQRAEALELMAHILQEVAENCCKCKPAAAGVPGDDEDILRSCVTEAATRMAPGSDSWAEFGTVGKDGADVGNE